MKLLLTSAGFTNPTIIAALQELIDKPLSTQKLAFITTAAMGEEGDKSWLINDLLDAKNAGFAKMEVLDFMTFSQQTFLPILEEADVILFGGGNTFYLMESLRKSGLDKLLPGLLKTRVYVGISAGSMVTAKHQMFIHCGELYEEAVGKVTDDSGLGFVNFQIRPHVNSEHFPNIRLKNLQEKSKAITDKIYALDDNSAIVVNGNEVKIVSEGEWKLLNA